MNYSEKEIPKISHAEKIARLEESEHDLLFMSDLQTVNDDFAQIDKTEIIDVLSFELDL